MTDGNSLPGYYRTFVRGQLVQLSALCVGGSQARPGDPDIQCALDGRGHPIIPGTALAGALVETAGRIHPPLFSTRLSQRDKALRAITGKSVHLPSEQDANWFLQSAVRFFPCHRNADLAPEIRQGVGIRQATGATAVEQRALFDLQLIPAGSAWDFLLEIDTMRAGPQAESLILRAILEWAAGRCWLGAAAARGTGWMQLHDVEALRLPMKREAVDAWPCNMLEDRNSLWAYLQQVARDSGGQVASDPAAVRCWAEQSGPELGGDEGFHYLVLDARFAAGAEPHGYGWDALSVGGHAAGLIEPPSDNLIGPLGMDAEAYRRCYQPDHPVVTEGDDALARPFVPGSSVRGPLRHATSRWHRGPQVGIDVVDPNQPGRPDQSNDPVARLFGLTAHSARLLVRDAHLVEDGEADGPPFRLVWLQHHAEDEFAGGVWGHSKFDRTAVLEGTFDVRLVIEAPSRRELGRHVRTLLPALQMAELGYLPLGGGKWRGLGWLPWQFTRVELVRAGQSEGQLLPVAGMITETLAGRFQQDWDAIEEDQV